MLNTDFSDYIDYLSNDSGTKANLIYAEGILRGGFHESCEGAKPIIA